MGNYAQLKYSYMIQDIQSRAATHEAAGEELVKTLGTELAELAAQDPQQAAAQRAERLTAHAVAVREDWGKLFELLVGKYAQGFVNTHDGSDQAVGYPQEWLDRTDYSKGPANSYAKPQ